MVEFDGGHVQFYPSKPFDGSLLAEIAFISTKMTMPLSQYVRWWPLIISCILVASFSISCTPESTPDPNDPKLGNPPETLLLKKITSGPQNIQTFSYSDQGLLTNFQSNWVYNDSLGIVSRTQAEFDYDDQHRLSQMRANGQYTVKFFYEGKLLDKSEEYDYKNRLVAIHFYLFNLEGQLVELLDQIHDPAADRKEIDSFVKYRYEYDMKKNVQRAHAFTRKADDSSFKAWQSVYFENYDDKKNPNNLLPSYPYVAQACTQVNNPGKITTKLSTDQSIISELTMAYVYNAQGYPIRKTQQLTTAQPVPATTFDYHYE